MMRWDLVSQALRLDTVRQSQLVAQTSVARRRDERRLARLPQRDRGEDRCTRPETPAAVPGTEWQRGILNLGAAYSLHQPAKVVA